MDRDDDYSEVHMPLEHGRSFWSYVNGRWYHVVDPRPKRGAASGEFVLEIPDCARTGQTQRTRK